MTVQRWFELHHEWRMTINVVIGYVEQRAC